MTIKTPYSGNGLRLKSTLKPRRKNRTRATDEPPARPPSVVKRDSRPRVVFGRNAWLAYSVTIAVALLFGISAMPVRTMDAVEYVVAGVAVTNVILLWLGWLQVKRKAEKIPEGSRGSGSFKMMAVALFLLMTSVGVSSLWLCNKVFDSSAAIPVTFMIGSKEISKGPLASHLHGVYHVHVDVLVREPLTKAFAVGVEDINVSKSEYDLIDDEHNKIILNMHSGFFRWPWYEAKPALMIKDATVAASGENHHGPDFPFNATADTTRLTDAASKRSEALALTLLAAYQTASSDSDKATLSNVAVVLSHLRWEYVYAGLPADRYGRLLDGLAEWIANKAPQDVDGHQWGAACQNVIEQNRMGRENRVGSASPDVAISNHP